MAVRLLSSMASVTQSWAAGEILEDLDQAAEARLVEAGAAEWVTPPKKQQTEQPEKKKAAKKEVR